MEKCEENKTGAVMPEGRPEAKWLGDVPEGDFISPNPTYRSGDYFDRFHKEYFSFKDGLGMKYYYFDPREHGYEAGRKYPVLVFLHGAGNSLVGDTCINYTGAEFYSKEEYQSDLGGAYILIPVANEYTGADGRTCGTWSDEYDDMLRALVDSFIREKTGGVNARVWFGTSSGGRYLFHLIGRYTSEIDIAVPIASSDIPGKDILEKFDAQGSYMFFAIGKRDEFLDFENEVAPRIPELEAMKHCFIFTPEWVRNGDKGIASIFAGVEMGQHCLVNSMHIDLKFDDGTPMDDRLAGGVTGWLAEAIREFDERRQ